MIYFEWPEDVNTDFYSGVNGWKDNTVTTEFLSGRTISHKANEKFLKTKELKLNLKNSGPGSEYEIFNQWITETLGGPAGIFHCAALDTAEQLYWKLQEMPTENNGQLFKEITLNIEQVYA